MKTAKRGKKRGRRKSLALAQAAAGSLDVLGAAHALLCIIVLLLMLYNLVSWLVGDLRMLFSDLGTGILDAVLVHGAGR